MLRLNFALKKVVTRDTSKNYFGRNIFGSISNIETFLARKSFSWNETSFLSSSTHSLPLNREIKLKKSEDLYESISKKFYQALKIKFNSNVVSLMKEKSKEKDSSLSIENLYSDTMVADIQLEQLNSGVAYPSLEVIRVDINSLIKEENFNKIETIKEKINELFNIISKNINSSDNKISLIEDGLKVLKFERNLHNKTTSLDRAFLKETIVSYLNILNSVQSLSIEYFKANEIFLFNVIQNHLEIEDVTDSELKLNRSLSTAILKLLEKFGDVVFKYSGENGKEMLHLYFLFADYYINCHNSDYSKADDYAQKATAISKQADAKINTNFDYLSGIKLSYLQGEIELNLRKDIKAAYTYFSEAFNLLNEIRSGEKSADLFTDEIFQILRLKISERYSSILLLSKTKFERAIEVSDNLIDGKYKINIELIKEHPSVLIRYLNYIINMSNLLSAEGLKKKSYDYIKYVYIVKREVNSERNKEIDLLSLTFEDSVDFYFLSHLFVNSTKLPDQDIISQEKLRSISFYLSNLLKDSLNGDTGDFSLRILNANVLKNIIDNIQKYKSENGIVFDNEEKIKINHLISTIRLNFVSADFEKASENLSKFIEIENANNSKEKMSNLLNLNCNLYYALTLIDKNKSIISCLENLKKLAKSNFELKKDSDSIEMFIEVNLDLHELFFEQNKINEGIDCLIEASEFNKNFEKINFAKFKFFSNKLKRIRNEIKNLKDDLENDSTDPVKDTNKSMEEKEQNKNKSALYGRFSKK